jgi:hypothetical protein
MIINAYDKGTRRPSSLLGALIRKFLQGFYTLVLDGKRKIAETWAGYEAANCLGFGKASEAMITKFLARHTSRVPFIVDDPTLLTHASHNYFYA